MLRDFIVEDSDLECAFWSLPEGHRVSASRIELDSHDYIVTNVTKERITDLIESGYDVDLHLHASTASKAQW